MARNDKETEEKERVGNAGEENGRRSGREEKD